MPEEENPKKFILFENNVVSTIKVNIHTPLFLSGSNIIDKLKIIESHSKYKSCIKFNSQQKIDVKGKHANLNKESFHRLRQMARDNDDKEQEIIFNREILKCEHSLIKLEPFIHTWENRIFFWYSKTVSNYGTSLIRPIALILFFHFIFTNAIFIINNSWGLISFTPAYIEAFNPVNILLRIVDDERNVEIFFITATHASVLLVLVCELIFASEGWRASRTLKKSGTGENADEISLNMILDILNFEGFDEIARHHSTFEDYKNWVNIIIDGDERLKGKISIEPNTDKEFTKRAHTSEDFGYKITIKHLFLRMDKTTNSKELIRHENSFKYIVFENNTFSYEPPPNSALKAESKSVFHLTGYYGIKFENNKFKNVKINLSDGSELYAFVIIKNNVIPIIDAYINSPLSFEGCNIIENLNISQNSNKDRFSLSWNSYQDIDSKGEFSILNKKSFLALKEVAVGKNDKLQESVLNREILKCDHYLIKKEPWANSWQDRLIMSFGKWSSNHGISWVKPLGWLIAINSAIAIIFYSVEMGDTKSFWYIFWEMFNPISSLSQAIKLSDDMDGGGVSFVNVIQKIIFAILIYELIRVGRRFVAK